MQKEGVDNEEKQFLKTSNRQGDFNKGLKNEDALYKFLSYSGMLEKKRSEDLNKIRKDNDIAFGTDTFEEFYKRQLQYDAKLDPRPLGNPSDYQPKKDTYTETDKIAHGFKTL